MCTVNINAIFYDLIQYARHQITFTTQDHDFFDKRNGIFIIFFNASSDNLILKEDYLPR